MKKIVCLFCLLAFCLSCGTIREVPIKTDTIVNYKDSLMIRDSVIIKDSIILVPVPVERFKDIVSLLDTSRIENSVAISEAYIDTTNRVLRHSLESKDTSLQKEVVFKDRIVYKDRVVVRDSTITKEVPVRVEVEKVRYPKSYWWLLGFCALFVIGIIVRIWIKLKTGK